MALEAPKVLREHLQPEESLCDHCTAKCCRYFALAIDTPKKAADFDFLRWYLLHDAATLFTEDDEWFLLVHTVCKHLQPDNRCGIYHTRPQICRDYSTEDCEYDSRWTYDRYFEMPEQVEEYVEAVHPPKGQVVRSAEPSLLPVIG